MTSETSLRPPFQNAEGRMRKEARRLTNSSAEASLIETLAAKATKTD